MTPEELAAKIDHTLVDMNATPKISKNFVKKLLSITSELFVFVLNTLVLQNLIWKILK